MTRDDIIRIAREAGVIDKSKFLLPHPHHLEAIHLFAELVKADFLEKSGQYITNDASRETAIKEAVESEREACAKACEAQADQSGGQDWYVSGCLEAAKSIRARSKT